MQIAVAGATGNVGRPLAEGLAARGHEVRAIARNTDRLKTLRRGVRQMAGNLEDEAFLKKALTGADAVFAMLPPNMSAPDVRAYQRRVVSSWTNAIRETGVPRVVTLSSFGAHLTERTGLIMGARDLEQSLNALEGVHVLHLRPGYFMENLLMGISLIKANGVNGSALREDLGLPMIATRDIANVALDLLSKPRFTGKAARELLGPRDYTLAEATRIIGSAIGKKELHYVQFPYDQARQSMLGAGVSASVTDAFIEMERSFNEGYITPSEQRASSNTTPTTLEAFAGQVFSRAFAA